MDLLYKASLLDEKYPDRFCIRPLDTCPYDLKACNPQCWGYQADRSAYAVEHEEQEQVT